MRLGPLHPLCVTKRAATIWAALVVALFAAEGLASDRARLVIVLYPEANDGSPGNALADRGIRHALSRGYRGAVEIHSEYLDVSRFPDNEYQQDLARFLRRKYDGRKIDLVIAGLASGLDYAVKYREVIFPGVPIVFCAVDGKEIAARNLPADVVGVPIQMELAASLATALRLLPKTERVVVVVGRAKFDADWEAEAHEQLDRGISHTEITYWAGLPMEDVLERAASLPEHSLIYYLHIFEDGNGRIYMPAEALELIASKANAPIVSHVDSYVGRGAIGGRVFGFESAGQYAGEIGARILAGERPEEIGIQRPGENSYVFDWRELRRWGISESSLPAGSIVRFKKPNLWEAYKWQITALMAICAFQGLMITGLMVQRSRRARAEHQRREVEQELRQSQATLRELAGELLEAEESERRRLARELHDDLGQGLALLSVELELLRQKPPADSAQLNSRVGKLSARINQLSSSIHELSHQLHPLKLEQLGLVAALSSFCREIADAHGLDVRFLHDEIPRDIRQDVAICLYRVAQEGLQNVVKHSRAQHALVELHLPDGELRLEIQDDGVGFDPDGLSSKQGLGLASMRERMRLVNGDVLLESRPAGGACIFATVPLADGDARQSQ